MSTVMNCPSCGVALRVDAMGTGSGGSGAWQSGRSFALGGPPPGSEYSREIPKADLSTLEAGVKTPLAQAAITATVCGLLVILGVVFKSWPLAAIPTTWVIVFSLAWWVLLLNTRGLLKTVEKIVGKDLDGDGQIGFSVELVEPLADRATDKMLFCHFVGVQPVHVVKFAQAAIDNRLTPDSSGLSRGKFGKVRTVCLARGLVTWRNDEYHAQGLDCSRGGRSAFQQIIEAVI